jgi:hypothetical protein
MPLPRYTSATVSTLVAVKALKNLTVKDPRIENVNLNEHGTCKNAKNTVTDVAQIPFFFDSEETKEAIVNNYQYLTRKNLQVHRVY